MAIMQENSTKAASASLVALGIGALFLMLWATTQGPGVSPDSTIYLAAAQSVLDGAGFLVQGEPMTHYPLVYPLALSVVGFSGIDLLKAARILHVMLFGLNVGLFGFAVCLFGGRKFVVSTCATLTFMLMCPVLHIHSMAWSESLFLTFSLMGFIMLSRYIVRPRVTSLLVASVMIGLAMVTRYVGVTLFPPLLFGILFMTDADAGRRLRDAAIGGLVACMPFGGWLLRNSCVSESATSRSFAVHLAGPSHVKQLIDTLYDAALPIQVSGHVKLLHLVVFGVLLCWGFFITFRHRKEKGRRQDAFGFATLLVLFSAVYIAFLFATISFADANTPLDGRMLFPVISFLLLATVLLVMSASDALRQPCICWGLIGAMLFSLSINMSESVPFILKAHRRGQGYTAEAWQSSEMLAAIGELPANRKIYSNGADVIRFRTGKSAESIPAKLFKRTRHPNPNYEEQLALLLGECERGEAVVAYFDRIHWRWYLPSAEAVAIAAKGLPYVNLSDGILYGVTPGE